VEDCIFERNKIGFYTNGYNTLVKNCLFIESGYGAIYSGSNSAHNQFISNEFRDNCLSQHQYSYGDFIGDTFWDTEISENNFMAPSIQTEYRRIGISLFRNMGESGKLRRQISRFNLISNNEFDGCSVAIHVGARMGRDTRNDVTGEGRDYAFYNTIESNKICNTAIGIKVNTEGNTIRNNAFENVEKEMVLHCVFFELKNTTIEHQDGDRVSLWYVKEDYLPYAQWFAYQDDLNGSIQKSEKLISAFSFNKSPDFVTDLEGAFMLNPDEELTNHVISDHRLGAPFQVTAGEISLEMDGKELVAIWKEPISRVKNTDYYSILIFDAKGTEINRCGRSEQPWKQIAVGHFLDRDDPMEIAAVPAEPIDEKYPVLIFRRGYQLPSEIRYPDNENPGINVTATEEHLLQVSFQK
jgi:hypothetical protein